MTAVFRTLCANCAVTLGAKWCGNRIYGFAPCDECGTRMSGRGTYQLEAAA